MSTSKTPAVVKKFFNDTLGHIESKSIREWASSEHNKPIILKMAASARNNGSDPVRFATYLVCIAIGA